MAHSSIDTCNLRSPDLPSTQFLPPSSPRKRTLEPDQGPPRALACPFFKRLPPSHPAVSSRACSSGWTSISRLKEHLYRVHSTDKLPCLRCYVFFNSSEDLQQHQQAGATCRVLPQPPETRYIIFPDKKARLRNRKKGVTNEEAWSSIWMTIFPGVSEPPDPYFIPPMERAWEPLGSRQTVSLQKYLKDLPSLVAADLIRNSSLNIDPEKENDVMRIVQSRLDKILNEWTHQPPGVPDELRDDLTIPSHDGYRVPTMEGLDKSAINARSLLKYRQDYPPLPGDFFSGVGDWINEDPQPLYQPNLDISSADSFGLGPWGLLFDPERSYQPLVDGQPLSPPTANQPQSFSFLERSIAFHSSPRNDRVNIRSKRPPEEEDNGICLPTPYIGRPDPL